MLNIIRKLYKWINGLKKYHTMHIIVIPQAVLFIFFYFFCIIDSSVGLIKTPDEESMLGALIIIFLVLYLSVISLSIAIAIIYSIFIILKEKSSNIKIRIKSDFILRNKFYHIIFISSIINFIIMLILLPFGLSVYFLTFILTFPVAEIYALYSFLIQHLF